MTDEEMRAVLGKIQTVLVTRLSISSSSWNYTQGIIEIDEICNRARAKLDAEATEQHG